MSHFDIYKHFCLSISINAYDKLLNIASLQFNFDDLVAIKLFQFIFHLSKKFKKEFFK